MKGTVAPSARSLTTAATPARGSASSVETTGTGSKGGAAGAAAEGSVACVIAGGRPRGELNARPVLIAGRTSFELLGSALAPPGRPAAGVPPGPRAGRRPTLGRKNTLRSRMA